MSNVIGNVLVDENNTNIVPGAECLKGFFHLLKFRILLDNQKVGALSRSVSNSSEQKASDGVLQSGCTRLCEILWT